DVVIVRDGDDYDLRCATTEIGQGAKRALSLEAARLLGVDVERIRFPDPDTSLVPYDTRTTSSRSTYMMSRALAEAVRDPDGFGGVRNEGGRAPAARQGVGRTHWD